MLYKIPLKLIPQPEGGYTVVSPLLPELITEGDTAEEALEHGKMPWQRCWRLMRTWDAHSLRNFIPQTPAVLWSWKPC
mgnify:CR=1 FL=1